MFRWALEKQERIFRREKTPGVRMDVGKEVCLRENGHVHIVDCSRIS